MGDIPEHAQDGMGRPEDQVPILSVLKVPLRVVSSFLMLIMSDQVER
jgi:hypothetical protein